MSWDPQLRAFRVASPIQNFPSLIKWNDVQHLITNPKIFLSLFILKKNNVSPKHLWPNGIITKNGLEGMVLSMTSGSSKSPTWTPSCCLMLSLSFGNISLQKSPKSWKLFPTCTSFVPKQLKSQSWASRGKGGEPESTMNRLRIWAGQGGGDLLVVEPPVAAVSEEVGFAVFPLEGCVHVTRQTSPPFLDVLQKLHNPW